MKSKSLPSSGHQPPSYPSCRQPMFCWFHFLYIIPEEGVCVHKHLFLHLKANKSYTLRISCFCGLITFFGISHNFRKAKHCMSVGLRYVQVDTYLLCVPSSWLWFNWFDNSSSFPKMRRAISPLGGHTTAFWFGFDHISYFQLSGVLKCT